MTQPLPPKLPRPPRLAPSAKARPSWWHALWGLPILLLGLGGAIYFLLGALDSDIDEGLTRTVVPGETLLELEAGQSYSIFVEYQSVIDGQIYSMDQPVSGLDCGVRSLNSGMDVDPQPARGRTQYTIGGRSGQSFLEFVAPESGSYRFSCSYRESPGPTVVVAVGQLQVVRFVLQITGVIGSLLGGLLGAGMPAAVVAILRSRRKQAVGRSNRAGATPLQ